jgi:hypothetical protein
MKGGGILDFIYPILFIVSVIGSLILGGWLVMKYYVPAKQVAPPPPPAAKPPPDFEPNAWEADMWGPDPWSPEPPAETPAPPPVDNFKPVLNLLSAKFDKVNRRIQLGYKILPSGDIPPSKIYTIVFDVLSEGKKLSEIPVDEPVTAAEMTGLQQNALIDVVDAPNDIKASDLTVSAQITFRENATLNRGVVGIPVTIAVS